MENKQNFIVSYEKNGVITTNEKAFNGVANAYNKAFSIVDKAETISEKLNALYAIRKGSEMLSTYYIAHKLLEINDDKTAWQKELKTDNPLKKGDFVKYAMQSAGWTSNKTYYLNIDLARLTDKSTGLDCFRKDGEKLNFSQLQAVLTMKIKDDKNGGLMLDIENIKKALTATIKEYDENGKETGEHYKLKKTANRAEIKKYLEENGYIKPSKKKDENKTEKDENTAEKGENTAEKDEKTDIKKSPLDVARDSKLYKKLEKEFATLILSAINKNKAPATIKELLNI